MNRIVKFMFITAVFAFVSAIIAIAAPTPVSAPVSIIIKVIQKKHLQHSPITSVYKLKKKGAAIYCETAQVPIHQIQVRGLKNLNPPFSNQLLSPYQLDQCKSVVSWGKTQACLSSLNSQVLTDLFRWCSQI